LAALNLGTLGPLGACRTGELAGAKKKPPDDLRQQADRDSDKQTDLELEKPQETSTY
jgi:hypothetical protein